MDDGGACRSWASPPSDTLKPSRAVCRVDDRGSYGAIWWVIFAQTACGGGPVVLVVGR